MALATTEDRNTQKDALQKMQIMEAAQSIFRQHGYVKASMDDIAKLASKSRTTLYKYYKNKDQVFEDFILSQIAEIVNTAVIAIGDASTLESKLVNYNAKKLELLRYTCNHYRNIMNDITDGTNHFAFIKERFSLAEKDVLIDIFQVSIAQKEIVPIETADLHFLISVITLALRGIENEAFSNGTEDVLLERRLTWLIGMLVRGLK